MVGGTSKVTNWSQAFRDAESRPDGELIGVHGQTLRGMEKQGAAYQRDGKWYLRGKGPGPVEEPTIEEPTEVEYTVQDTAYWQLHLDVKGAPDTEHPDHPGGTLRPVGISMGIGQTGGVWSVSAVNVFGQKVKDGKVVTKRNYPLPFMDPLDEDSGAPEWLRKICQDWVDKANGAGRSVVEVSDVEDIPTSAELAQRIRVRQEQAHAAAAPKDAVDRPRERFDSALNVLLMRENQRGAEWAIWQIIQEADTFPDNTVADVLRTVSEKIQNALAKHAAELGAREN